MMKIPRNIFALLMLLFVLFGCMTPAGTPDPNGSDNPSGDSASSEETGPRATPTALAGDADPGPGTTATPVLPTPTATVIVPTAVTPYPDGDFWILPEGPLAPTDFGEALHQQIETGEVSAESGIIAGLDYLLGEGDAAIFGALTPVTSETHGIVEMAEAYLETGPDVSAKAEIQARLDRLIPSVEALLPFAEPQPAQSALPTDVRAKAVLQDEDCEDLWASGFPPGADVTCILFTEAALVNGVARVYYPETWYPSGETLPYVSAATSAVVHAMEVFAPLGVTGSVDMVFSLLPSQSATTLASVPFAEGEACLIMVYPFGVATGKAKGTAYFQQKIAHEVFHCLQGWNMPADEEAYFGANRWWIEGSAEYFSNLVYPEANTEWEFVIPFDDNSAVKPLYKMGYETTVFFQYLGNTIGDQAIFNLLKSIPPSADVMTSVQTFAAYPDMQKIFHEFAQAWANQAIYDSSGAALPNNLIIFDANIFEVNEAINLYPRAELFFLERYRINFAEGNRYINEVTAGGAAGYESSRVYSPVTFWGALPEEIGAGCGDESHLFLVTTMQSGVGKREVEIDVTTENDPECDQCLVGSWTLNLETFFKSYVRTLFEDDNIDFNLTEVSGGFQATFTPGGIYYGEYDSLLIKYDVSTMGLEGPIGMGTTIYYDGSGLGTYFTDGATLQVYSGISTVKYQMSMGFGEGKIHDIPATGFGIGENQPYTCNGDTLTFEKLDEGSGQMLTYQYDRVPEK